MRAIDVLGRRHLVADAFVLDEPLGVGVFPGNAQREGIGQRQVGAALDDEFLGFDLIGGTYVAADPVGNAGSPGHDTDDPGYGIGTEVGGLRAFEYLQPIHVE